MATLQMALRPRDGFFFKDGRGWFAASSGRGHALPWPFPSTILGVLRTAWGLAAESTRGRPFTREDWAQTLAMTLGPMLPLRRRRGEEWTAAHRMWPVPADALYVEGERHVRRLHPTQRKIQTLGREDNPALEGLLRPDLPAGKPSASPQFWTDNELSAWLSGRPVPAIGSKERDDRALPRRVEVRVQIDPATGSTVQGALFATETLETLQQTADNELFEWAIGAEVGMEGADLEFAGHLTLGSDRRLATWEKLRDVVTSPFANGGSRDATGLRLMVVTPAHFKAGWLPDGFKEVEGEYTGKLPGLTADLVLRAAFVPRPVHVSGWDMVKGRAKPTRRLVPAGSVYFFEKVARVPFTAAEMKALWLLPLGQDTNEGFGRVIAAPWEIR